MTAVAGIVLGAGTSTRLGRPKQSLPLGSGTVLGLCVAAAESSSLDRVVLIVGNAADEALESVTTERAVVAHNQAYGSGCASSLLAGMDAVGRCDALVMLLGDMPTLTPRIIDAVVDAWRAKPTWAAVTRYQGERLGHPLVFAAAAFPALRALHGDKAVWQIIDREPEAKVRRIDVDAALPPDIDTWDDYLAVASQLGVDPAAR